MQALIDDLREKVAAPLLVVEAMKMQHTISTTHDGAVEKPLYEVGAQGTAGAQPLTLSTLED